MMRVITGLAKGTQLKAPAGETTRPTSERSKEAMFSMIQFEVEGRRVLDLFAGSGQLGIEALSRGAKSAVFVDQSAPAVQVIQSNLQKTKLQEKSAVFGKDGFSFLQGTTEKFDLVFLDPPYAAGAIPKALSGLLERDLLLPGAILLCESADPDDVFGGDSRLSQMFLLRSQKKHGVAYLTLLELAGKEKD